MKSLNRRVWFATLLCASLFYATSAMARTQWTVNCFYNDGTYWSGQTTDYSVMQGMLQHCKDDGGRGANITYVNR